MAPGILRGHTAVGTAEAANVHSCFCLPTLLRRTAVGGRGNGGRVLFDKMRSHTKAHAAGPGCLSSKLLNSCSPQTTHLYLPPPDCPLSFFTMLNALMSHTRQAAGKSTHLVGKRQWPLLWALFLRVAEQDGNDGSSNPSPGLVRL